MLKKLILKQLNGAVAINKQLKQNLSSLGVPEEKIVFIPNGVDTQKFKPAADKMALRAKLGLPLDKTILVFTGRLVKQKGIDTLMQTFAALEKDNANIFLLVVGGVNKDVGLVDQKKAQADLEKKAWAISIDDAYKKAADLGINNVKFTGFVNNVNEQLAASDVFVFPSLTEGMSNALLEAMSTGLTVVASDIPANTAVINNGVTGLTFVVKDTDDLFCKIKSLLDQPELLVKLGREARDNIEQNYSIDKVLAKYLELFTG